MSLEMSAERPKNDKPPRMFQVTRRAAVISVLLLLIAAVFVGGRYYMRHADHPHVAPIAEDLGGVRAAFPLMILPGSRYLSDQKGAPFLIHGEAAWSLIAQLTREEAEAYLENRRSKGINLIIVNLLEHHFADDAPSNIYGAAPLSTPGDFSTPSDQYFEFARNIVRIAAGKGIAVLLCPAYLGGDGGNEGWYQEMRRNGPEKMHAYGRYVGAHFREFDNVIWLQAGDFTPPAADLPLVAAVANGIRETSPIQMHTAHWSPETSAMDVTIDAHFEINTTYTYLPAYLESIANYDHGNGRPHFLVETKYEGDELGSTQRSLRGQAYYALLTGAAGQVCGNRWIWPFVRPNIWNRLFGTNWKSALDSPMSRSMGYVHKLFAKLPWTTLVPDEAFEVQMSGQGSKGQIDYPVLAWRRDGSLAVAYIPTSKGIRLNSEKLAKPLKSRWYDPTDGQFIDAVSSPSATMGGQDYVPPGRNASGDTDWVLVVEAVTH